MRRAAETMSRALSAVRRHAYAGAVGFGGGACVGLVGWGGAQIIIPGMTNVGHSQLAATGISLCSLSLSTVTGAAKFVMEDSVCLATAAAIAIPSIFTARLGTRLAARVPDDALQFAFNGLSLALIPTYFLVQQDAARRGSDRQGDGGGRAEADGVCVADASAAAAAPTTGGGGAASGASDAALSGGSPSGLARAAQHGAFGCVSGLISAMMGIGGLPLTMTFLTASTELPHHLVQGTAVLSVAPSAITSALTRWSVIPAATAGAVAVGAMGGAASGASVALRLSEERLRGLYMLSLLVLGGRSFVMAARNLSSMLARRGAVLSQAPGSKAKPG